MGKKKRQDQPNEGTTVALSDLSNKSIFPKMGIISKIKNAPFFYGHIIIHLYYRSQLRLSEISRLIERPAPNTQMSLFRMMDLNLISRSNDGYFYLTAKGRNEVEALRSMFFQ